MTAPRAVPESLPGWAEARMSYLWMDVRDLEAMLTRHGPEAAKYMGDLPEIAERLARLIEMLPK